MAISGDTAARPASATTNQSLILALHGRYEQAWIEYNAVYGAGVDLNPKNEKERILSLRYDDAIKANARESDALRRAILHQVPDTWPEAMVLQFHIWTAHDLENRPSQEDQAALATALDTLFDFMACETHQDHEALGKQFQSGAMQVFERRRLRTGMVED